MQRLRRLKANLRFYFDMFTIAFLVVAGLVVGLASRLVPRRVYEALRR